MADALAAEVIAALVARKLTIATAESCTGGLVAAALTSVPGSSDAVYGGFVTYANAAKTAMIGVPADMIEAHGAVSPEVARAMAEGGRARAGVDMAVAITGIAGPGGGSDRKPVGLVYIAAATATHTEVRENRFGDLGRDTVRARSVEAALRLVMEVLP